MLVSDGEPGAFPHPVQTQTFWTKNSTELERIQERADVVQLDDHRNQ
ncbi:MAG TPA: hypothetical protein VNY55_05655 [Mycobacterium sp.]|nr:hypothetical protein [Mycobacterium sp.]